MKNSYRGHMTRESGEKRHMYGIRRVGKKLDAVRVVVVSPANAIIAAQDVIDATCAELREQVANAHGF